MNSKQRLELRAGEIRSRLATLGGMETLTDEYRAEIATLRVEYRDAEDRIGALAISDDTPHPIETRSDPQGRELRGLLQRGNLGAMVDSIREQRSFDGANGELAQHYGLLGNQIPVAMLREWDDGPLETRAATPAPSDVGSEQHSISPYVFPAPAAMFLGIEIPTVGTGEQTYPTLTSVLSVHTPAENATAAETTGAFSADVLSPSRLQASFFYSREDRARFAMLDSSLRENLSAGLQAGLDKQIISGPNGLLGANGLTVRAGDAGATATFSTYRGLVYDNVTIDGRYASMASDVKIVMGPHGYNHAAGVYRGNSADDSGLDSMMRVSGGVMVSAHVPDPSTNDQDVIIVKGVGRRNMTAPVWEGLDVVFDEISKASAGQIVLTAYMMFAVKILRADGFQRRAVQVA